MKLKIALASIALVGLAAAAYATAPTLLPNPGASNEGVQTMAPAPANDRTYTHNTKTMKCYSTASGGVPNKVLVGFDARVIGTGVAVRGKLSKNRSTTHYEVTSGRDYAVDPSTTSFCYQPYSSATQVESNWRGR